jgi:hypothetical protein
MFRLYLGHLQALKIEIHTVNEQCIVGSQTLTIYRVDNNENKYVAVLMVYNNRLSKHIYKDIPVCLNTSVHFCEG